MLLKVALVALVFVAVHGQAIDNPEDRVDSMARPLGPTNGRQRRSSDDAISREKYNQLIQILDEMIERIRKMEKSKE
ncbi:unnamed protein product [Nippostrongylus brasiliensis]|uniref:Secreted protein n=1 Tax=Nippostrongylus brasiliensis TaxID=27835 RepID=A0A0N4XY59_NIPBR|nr:unnamed protein product [Nippostrongylus brasiliensis]